MRRHQCGVSTWCALTLLRFGHSRTKNCRKDSPSAQRQGGGPSARPHTNARLASCTAGTPPPRERTAALGPSTSASRAIGEGAAGGNACPRCPRSTERRGSSTPRWRPAAARRQRPPKVAARRSASRRPPRGERRHGAVRRAGRRRRHIGSAPKRRQLADRPAAGRRAASATKELKKR